LKDNTLSVCRSIRKLSLSFETATILCESRIASVNRIIGKPELGTVIKMSFKLGVRYSRKDIHNEIGGETETYLPQKYKQVVCGCFKLELNSDVPLEVQVGEKPTVVAKTELLEQQANQRIPIFVQDPTLRKKNWIYRGLYDFVELVRDKSIIEAAAQKTGRVGKLTYLIRFKPVK